MGIKFYEEPKLERPDMIACWPGIGNIGIIAVDALRSQLKAEEFGEIEPWHFVYPNRVIIKDGILRDLEFPRNKFFFKKRSVRDLVFFTSEEQPAPEGAFYARGKKAYEMANLVLDVAEKLGCRRIYTSGAAVAPIHHTRRPGVWIAATNQDLLQELKGYRNTILMSEMRGDREEQSITGLNGLLPGLAQKRGFEAACIMGEIPDYLVRASIPYPRASKAVMEVFASVLELEINYKSIDEMISRADKTIEQFYEEIPQKIRERIEQRESLSQPKGEPIKDEDKEWIKDHIDEFFKRGKDNEKCL